MEEPTEKRKSSRSSPRDSAYIMMIRFMGLVALLRWVRSKRDLRAGHTLGLNSSANNTYDVLMNLVDHYMEFYAAAHNANFNRAKNCEADPELCGCRKPCSITKQKPQEQALLPEKCKQSECNCEVAHAKYCANIEECTAIINSGLFQGKHVRMLLKNHERDKIEKPENIAAERRTVTRTIPRKIINLLLVHLEYPDLAINSLEEVLNPDVEMKKRLFNARALSVTAAERLFKQLKDSDLRMKGNVLLLADDPSKGDDYNPNHVILNYHRETLEGVDKSNALCKASRAFTWMFQMKTVCTIFSINYKEFENAVDSDIPISCLDLSRISAKISNEYEADEETEKSTGTKTAGQFVAKRPKRADPPAIGPAPL